MAQGSKYPLPKFHFVVEWNGTTLGFTEVTGLDIETPTVEHRAIKKKIKMPGLQKSGNITLKRGILISGAAANIPSVNKSDLIIRMINERDATVSEWKLLNAFPVKIQAPDMKASGNEVAIESIELTHEGLCLLNC